MKAVTYRVEGLACPSCAHTIQAAVQRLPGMSEVEMLFNSGKLKTRFDENQLNEIAISDIIDKLGYHAVVIQ